MRIDSFHKIAKNYKVIFFDSFGVLRNYNGIIPGAQNTFNELLTQGIDYFILTN
ncbi:MAG: TIGR01459 family HAD-type hydrolase, partial [Bacteroidetes bacterium]|nr:TIGR01459 family HAD-type hydrolase [Bacteroidota bacterium]